MTFQTLRKKYPKFVYEKFPKKLSENLKMLWQNWYGARVLILGFGREGIDNFLFLRKLFPKKVLGIADRTEFKSLKRERLEWKRKKILSHILYDRRKYGIKMHLGENYLKSLKDYDVIIKSPGVPIHLPEVEEAFKEGKITSQTEIFLENFKGGIVGVTGTKGKGTTVSLIYNILKEGGLKVHLGGNIGKPVLTALSKNNPDEIFVYEISSHQLYNIARSPQIAVLLNISPAHLDYYKNFREYIKAKANIAKHQKKDDFLIYNSGDKIIREIAKKSKAKKIPIPTNYEFFTNIRIPSIREVNLQNINAAIAVGKICGVSNQDIVKAIKDFKPLPHRLEFVGTHRGISFYDDSAATVPEATLYALKTLGNKVQTIILGGYENNVSFKELAKKIADSEIKTVILFPPSGEKIWKNILSLAKSKKIPQHFFVNNMRDAVKISYKETAKGKICLLSCASPSFGLFKNYKQRGNLFRKYIKLLGK